MEESTFVVLYTHQKNKKAKTWQDGILRRSGTKALLYDDKNSKIDTLHVKYVQPGDEIESDRHMIQIESVLPDKSSIEAQKLPSSTDQPQQMAINVGGTSAPRPGLPKVGLKRKKTGFQPPRQLKPMISEGQSSSLPGGQHTTNSESDVSKSNQELNIFNMFGRNSQKGRNISSVYKCRSQEENPSSFLEIQGSQQYFTNSDNQDITLDNKKLQMCSNIDKNRMAEEIKNAAPESVGRKLMPSPWSVIGQETRSVESLPKASSQSCGNKELANICIKRSTLQVLALIKSKNCHVGSMPEKNSNTLRGNDNSSNKPEDVLDESCNELDKPIQKSCAPRSTALENKLQIDNDHSVYNSITEENGQTSRPSKENEESTFDLNFSPLSDVANSLSPNDSNKDTKITDICGIGKITESTLHQDPSICDNQSLSQVENSNKSVNCQISNVRKSDIAASKTVSLRPYMNSPHSNMSSITDSTNESISNSLGMIEHTDMNDDYGEINFSPLTDVELSQTQNCFQVLSQEKNMSPQIKNLGVSNMQDDCGEDFEIGATQTRGTPVEILELNTFNEKEFTSSDKYESNNSQHERISAISTSFQPGASRKKCSGDDKLYEMPENNFVHLSSEGDLGSRKESPSQDNECQSSIEIDFPIIGKNRIDESPWKNEEDNDHSCFEVGDYYKSPSSQDTLSSLSDYLNCESKMEIRRSIAANTGDEPELTTNIATLDDEQSDYLETYLPFKKSKNINNLSSGSSSPSVQNVPNISSDEDGNSFVEEESPHKANLLLASNSNSHLSSAKYTAKECETKVENLPNDPRMCGISLDNCNSSMTGTLNDYKSQMPYNSQLKCTAGPSRQNSTKSSNHGYDADLNSRTSHEEDPCLIRKSNEQSFNHRKHTSSYFHQSNDIPASPMKPITHRMLHSALKNLPHPSRIGKVQSNDVDAGQKMDVLSKVNAKLAGYSFGGAKSGAAARRDSVFSDAQKSAGSIHSVNVHRSQLSQSGTYDAQDDQAITDQHLDINEDGPCFYYFNPSVKDLSQYDHDKQFMFTGRDLSNSLDTSDPKSPIQEVPPTNAPYQLSPIQQLVPPSYESPCGSSERTSLSDDIRAYSQALHKARNEVKKYENCSSFKETSFPKSQSMTNEKMGDENKLFSQHVIRTKQRQPLKSKPFEDNTIYESFSKTLGESSPHDRFLKRSPLPLKSPSPKISPQSRNIWSASQDDNLFDISLNESLILPYKSSIKVASDICAANSLRPSNTSRKATIPIASASTITKERIIENKNHKKNPNKSDDHCIEDVTFDIDFDENPFGSQESDEQTCITSNRISNISCVGDRETNLSFQASATKVNEAQVHVPTPFVGAVKRNNRGFQPPRQIGSSNFAKPWQFTAPDVVSTITPDGQENNRNLCGDIVFPSRSEAETSVVPARQAHIPLTFSSHHQYSHILNAAIREQINIQLLQTARVFFSCLSKVDVTEYVQGTTSGISEGNMNTKSNNPPCEHGLPSKIVQVKKEGPNKGRFFFACNGQRKDQCKFFQWADKMSKSLKGSNIGCPIIAFGEGDSISTFFKGQGINLYCGCRLIRKATDKYKYKNKFLQWNKKFENDSGPKKLYINLSRREGSSQYGKDDLWVISSSLSFEPEHTFVARSAFFGPTSENDVEITPVSCYSSSNWRNEMLVHCIHVGNMSTELVCLSNIDEYLSPVTMPILPALLDRNTRSVSNVMNLHQREEEFESQFIQSESERLIDQYSLNEDQAKALKKVAEMLVREKDLNITLIQGVFGAGKSFLLGVVVLLLVAVFSRSRGSNDHRVLISSTTNVAVDRILQSLLQLGFTEFIRVGSVKKIAKPILPYSVHATGSDSQELKDLQDMLRSETITPSEKALVRKSIEQHKKGENKKKLTKVKVVGVTCASCVFQCIKDLKFKVVLLDECSQMTEPASLLPIARFYCEKLVLVGDPKQLNPTIQSESTHENGLEQTLMDRLIAMGHEAVLLRMQYRCHPLISAISNHLFYDRHLIDGVKEKDRLPLADGWPTLCFYNVNKGLEETDRSASYFNTEEAKIVVQLIECLVLEGIEPANIGVITLYKAQVSHITQLLMNSSVTEHSELRAILISTVDAFQGGERGVIILSCVRTQSMGFIDCHKRTNVALTRSKNHLFIVGHRRNLAQNTLWSRVLDHCSAIPNGMQNASNVCKQHASMTAEHPRSLETSKTNGESRERKRKNISHAESGEKKGSKIPKYSGNEDMEIADAEDDCVPEAPMDISTPQHTTRAHLWGTDLSQDSSSTSSENPESLVYTSYMYQERSLTAAEIGDEDNIEDGASNNRRKRGLLNPNLFEESPKVENSSDESLPPFL